MRIFISMKTRLNITIENSVLSQMKDYAASKQTTVSQIIEDYMRSIVKSPSKRKISWKSLTSWKRLTISTANKI
ncbi:DUF6364 family protein [Dyadobacter bucti]|uniref:DUF6364 family protein n=1 Tax=Dyadobacter bucti TaxID=2572203 RepID=UPI0035B60DC7